MATYTQAQLLAAATSLAAKYGMSAASILKLADTNPSVASAINAAAAQTVATQKAAADKAAADSAAYAAAQQAAQQAAAQQAAAQQASAKAVPVAPTTPVIPPAPTPPRTLAQITAQLKSTYPGMLSTSIAAMAKTQLAKETDAYNTAQALRSKAQYDATIGQSQADAAAREAAAQQAAAAKTAAAQQAADAARAAKEKADTDAAAAKLAAANKAAADQAAAAKAAAAVQTQQALQGEIIKGINAGNLTQSQLDDIQKRATAAGVKIDASYLDRATNTIATAKAAPFVDQLNRATTAADIDRAVAAAKAAGVTINQGTIDQARTVATQKEATAAAAVKQKTTDQLTANLLKTTSTAQIDDIVKQAKDQGITLNPGYVDQARQVASSVQAKLTTDPGYKIAYDQLTSEGKAFTASDIAARQNTNAEAARAAEAAKVQKELLQSNIPMTGQDTAVIDAQNIKRLLATDNPQYKSAYDQLVASGQKFGFNDVLRQGNANSRAQSNAELRATMAALNPGEMSFGDFIKQAGGIMLKTYLLGALGDAVSSAPIDEIANNVTNLVNSGATPDQISTALEQSGVSADVSDQIANQADRIGSGEITPELSNTLQSAGVPQQTIQAVETASTPAATAPAVPTGVETVAPGPVAPPPGTIDVGSMTQEQLNQALYQNNPYLQTSGGTQLAGPAVPGALGGTAESAAQAATGGTSLNPISNLLQSAGVTNPIALGALTGAGTTAAINLLTGKPITLQNLATGALGGGVAGGVGTLLPNPSGSLITAGLNAAATNVAGTTAVNLVTGRPITIDSLATSALVGGAVGGAIQAYSNLNGTTTYQWDDGSSMTVDKGGAPVAVTDNTGASVPVAGVDAKTGQTKQLAPVEDRQGVPVQSTNNPGNIAVTLPDGTQGTFDPNTNTAYDSTGRIIDDNITPGNPINTAGPYRVDISGQPATDQMTALQRAEFLKGPLPEGTNLANSETPGAYYDIASNAWVVPAGPVEITQPIVPEEVGGGTVPAGPTAGETEPVETTVKPEVINADLSRTTTYPDGSSRTVYADGSALVRDTAGQVVNTTPAPPKPTGLEMPEPGPTPVPVEPVPAPVGPTGPTTPGEPTGPTGPTTPGQPTGPTGPTAPTAPTEPVVGPTPTPTPVQPTPTPTPVPVIEEPVGPLPQPEQPEPAPTPAEPGPTEPAPAPTPTEPPYVAPPVYVPPIDTTTPKKPGYGPITPLDWGKTPNITAAGLNPGWITNVPPQYQTQNMQQSKFYWGQHPFQAGPTFNKELYTQAPAAPVTPWGLQEMYTPMNIQQYVQNAMLQNQAGIAPAPAPGPVKPV